jgi:diguanylate cyclase (GGDEF)-like protein
VKDVSIPRRLWPFASAAVFGVVLGLVPGTRTDLVELAVAIALTGTVVFAGVVVPWSRAPRWTRALPPFAYLFAVALMRDATGGATTGFGPLLLLPVFWLALYGTRRELLAMLAGVALVFYGPMFVIGGDAYPVVGWRSGALFVVVAAIIGLSTQALIRQLRALLADRAELLSRFERLATTDALTDLLNRRAWDEALVKATAAARRSGDPVAIAVLDLDHFKALNDRHGHQHGDHVLGACAAAWSAELRPNDLLARLGGEEFGLLLECSLDTARAIVERVREATPHGETCSAGVTMWDGVESPNAMVARADRLLYEAKALGRDRAVAAAPDLAPA